MRCLTYHHECHATVFMREAAQQSKSRTEIGKFMMVVNECFGFKKCKKSQSDE